MKKAIILACFALLAGYFSQGQVAAWDFYGQSFPVTCAATTFHPNLVATGGADNITRGPGAPASGGVNSFRTTGFQNNGISVTAGDYFQVTLQAAPGYKLSLSTLDAKFNGTATFFAAPGVTSQFAYSLDGVAFTLIGSPVQSTSLNMSQVDLTGIPDLQHVYPETMVTIRYYASGQTATGGWGFYSGSPGTNGFTVGGTVSEALVSAPSFQASGIIFNNIQQTQMGLSWLPGNGEKRLVKINTTNSFTDPANGTDPPAGTVYTGNGEQVVYNYSGSNIPAITGLISGETYWFRIYECNGSGSLTMFNTTTAMNNPAAQATSTLVLPPSITPVAASFITPVSAVLGGHITADGGSPVTARGTVWKTSSPVTISDNNLADGTADTGLFTHLRSSLPPATRIYHAAYAVNSAGTTLSSEADFFTLSLEPPAHVTDFSAATAGATGIDLTWNPPAAGADGYLILQKQGTSPPTGIPEDGGQYNGGETLGDGAVAAITAPGTAGMQTIAGLTPGTAYSFSIFPFSGDGVNPETTNYYSQLPVPSAGASTAIPASATYHWSGAAGTDWTVAGNWNPARNVPAPNDILVFDAGGAWTIVNVPVQTIGQMAVGLNTAVTLQGPGTLTIAGEAGDDLAVGPGCQLNISGAGVVSISIAAGATGVVSGSMTLSGGGHRLLAASANSLVFTPGAIFRAGSGFTGNPFGTANLNSVVFGAGSVYVCQAGGNPFGAAAPASVVVFQPGSLFRIDAFAVPSFGGRTYGNFEMNYPGTVTVTGSSAVSIENFTASQGTFYFNTTGVPGHSIRGNISIASVATLIFAPSSAGTVNLNSTTPQTVSGSGTLMAGANSTVVVANAAGVTLNKNATFNNLVVSGGASLIIAPNAEVTVTGNLINQGPATGLVVEPDGSLLHASAGVAATVKRSFAAADWSDWQDGWHLLSSPVAGQEINETGGFITSGTGNDFELFCWSEPGNSWINYKNSTVPPLFTTINSGNHFEPGMGYLVAYQQAGDKIFTGEMNVADITHDNLTVTGGSANYRGWYLLGNPYSCALTWYSGWSASNIGGVAYTWNEAGMSYTPRNPGEVIPACNGFMVQVMENPGNQGSLTIPAAQRIHSTQAWFKETGYPVIRLIARNRENSSFQECQVRFNPASTVEFDPVYDGRFLKGYAPEFYSVCRDEKLAVNSLPGPPEHMRIPLGFRKNEGDLFQIEALVTGELPMPVTLKDKKTGVEQNISKEMVYDFISEDADISERFELIFSRVEVGEPPGGRPAVSSSGNGIMISHWGDLHFEIFSILGKTLLCGNLYGAGTDKVVAGVMPGWYLVRVGSSDHADVTKVFIH